MVHHESGSLKWGNPIWRKYTCLAYQTISGYSFKQASARAIISRNYDNPRNSSQANHMIHGHPTCSGNFLSSSSLYRKDTLLRCIKCGDNLIQSIAPTWFVNIVYPRFQDTTLQPLRARPLQIRPVTAGAAIYSPSPIAPFNPHHNLTIYELETIYG